MIAPLPPDEPARLRALARYGILDTDAEQQFDDITLLASRICGTPIATITLLDENRQWFKSKVGLTETETSRDVAFCAHTILQTDVFVVEDARTDERFASNPLVTGSPHIRFYAGAPLITPDGHALGTVCVIDRVPHVLGTEEKSALQALSRQVVSHFELKRTLAELLQSEEQFTEAFEHARIGVSLMSPEGRWLRVNQALCDMFGYSKEELLVRSFKDLTHPSDLVASTDKTEQMLAGEIPSYEIEKRYLHASGRVINASLNVSLVRDGEGRPRHFISQIQDITERKKSERALQQAEEKYRSIFEHSSEGIFQNTPEGKFLSANPALARILGFDSAEDLIQGRDDIERQGYVDSSAHAEFKRRLEEAGVITDFEYEVYRKDGSRIWVSESSRVVRDANGVPLFYEGSVKDITDRKRAEAAAFESKRFLRSTLDALSSHIAILDEHGTIIEVNGAWNRFADGNQIKNRLRGVGDNYLRLCDAARGPFSEEAPLMAAGIRAVMAGKSECFELEYPCHAPQEERWFIARVTRFEGADVLRVVVAHENISARKRAELGLTESKRVAEEANRTKSEFLANMSHEIRTPMNGVLGMTELVLESSLTDEQRGYLNMAHTSGQTLLALINDILDFSKIEAGRMELESIDFNLRETISHLLKPLVFRAGKKQIELVTAVDSEIPEQLIGDPLRLRQILLNFADNAIKFTKEGTITVEVTTEAKAEGEQCLHFAVIDTGIGIPLEKQGVIFEAFAQADGSTTRHHGGTGLGLSIASHLVQQMRGKVWIESEVGAGTTFHFTAWFGVGPSAKQSAVSKPEVPVKSAPTGGGLRILLAEDNAINRALANVILTKRGHPVVHAKNGHEACKPPGTKSSTSFSWTCRCPKWTASKRPDLFAKWRIARPAHADCGHDCTRDDRRPRTLPRRRDGRLHFKAAGKVSDGFDSHARFRRSVAHL